MEFIPVKTRVLTPPKDDLFAVLKESLPSLEEGDIVCITSKVVAIHQGRSVLMKDADKAELVKREADHLIVTDQVHSPLTIKFNTFLGSAGIDESNGNGFYILPPIDVFDFAATVHAYLKDNYGLTNVGVVITDSHSGPFRFGATGVAIGCWGFSPIASHIGKKDLFGREIKFERSNLADAIAAGAVLVSGEVAECLPVVVARGVPAVSYTNQDHQADLMTNPESDRFGFLYKRFIK